MLFESLFAHARQSPDEMAIIDDQGEYTFAQIAAMAAGLGAYLQKQTARPHVGLLLPSGAGFVASFYGALLAGKSVVPINFLLSEREVAHVIADSGIDTVVTVRPLAARLKDLPLKVVDLLLVPKTPPEAIEPVFPTVTADDLAVLMYTSGTSGLPKGVMLSYGNLQSDVDACIEHAALQRRHVFLGVIPLFHAFGMTAMMLAPIQLGSLIVYMARFSPAGAVAALRKHRASIMFGVPSMFAAMLRVESATADDFSHIFAMISGGEPLPPTLREGFIKRFGTAIHEGYGLTETSPVVALNTPAACRPGSVGRAVPGVEVRVVNDEGRALGTDQEGEVWLRGEMIMKGYYKLPAETAAALTTDGFLRTGDLGKVDADGFLYITGRKKDLIIAAGEKIVPREIEDVLRRNAEVAEVAVVGRKDPTRGEAVVAFVVLATGAAVKGEDLRNFCREQGLAQFKVPREVVVVSELPRNATGKILKRELVERANRVGG